VKVDVALWPFRSFAVFLASNAPFDSPPDVTRSCKRLFHLILRVLTINICSLGVSLAAAISNTRQFAAQPVRVLPSTRVIVSSHTKTRII
jgi:hypothetical protein